MTPRPLGPDEVRVVVVEVEPGAESWARPLLAPAEVERADRFHFARDRVLFTVAHGALRRVLGAYLGADPAALAFEREAGGRPVLPGGELHFSLSHSGDRALVAVAPFPRLGVDVEVFRAGLDLARLAERNYTPAERGELAAAGADPRAFFRVWTRKEAYVKALGKGLYHPLADFDVSAGPEARFLAFRDGSRLEGWSLVDLDLGPGRAGALAAGRPGARVVMTRFDLAGS